MTYPIVETQLRLIRALQKGYVEALEAADWQSADYRCSHLHKLCEGLHYLSLMLDKTSVPEAAPPKRVNGNGWVSSIRSVAPAQPLNSADRPVTSATSEPFSETPPDPMRYAWGGDPLGVKPKPVDEVW